MEFLVRFLALLCLSTVIHGMKWFWIESLWKNIQLLLVFLKVPFLAQHFYYYTSMTFLILLYLILLRCWDCLSLLNSIEAITFVLFLKLPQRKLDPWFALLSFFLLRLLYISINLLYDLACNTVVMPGLVFLVAAWIC